MKITEARSEGEKEGTSAKDWMQRVCNPYHPESDQYAEWDYGFRDAYARAYCYRNVS